MEHGALETVADLWPIAGATQVILFLSPTSDEENEGYGSKMG